MSNSPNPESPINYLPPLQDQYDVVVVGGGPAGSTTAALVAEHGHSVLLLERAQLPRFHVGESLIPETYWPLKRLGLIERLKQSAFPRKYSVQFVSDGVKESAPFYFELYNQHESSVTWQVDRGEFDQMLMDRAKELGTVAHTSAHVTEVIFEDDQAVGVKCRLLNEDGGRTEREIRCKIVVDATGQSAFISSRRGQRDADPMLKKGTIWNLLEGRTPRCRQGRRGYAHHADARQEVVVLVHPSAGRRGQHRLHRQHGLHVWQRSRERGIRVRFAN